MEQRSQCAACDIMKSAVVWQLRVHNKTSGRVENCEEPPALTTSHFLLVKCVILYPFLQHIWPHQCSDGVFWFCLHALFIHVCPVTQVGNRAWTCESRTRCDSSTNAAGWVVSGSAQRSAGRGSFKVIFIFIFVQVQVAVRTGDLKEVSLCQTQLTGDVLP